MGGRFAAFALIAVLVLAGCTGTPGHPDGPGPTAPAISSPATTPTTPAALSDPPDTSSAPTSPAPAVGTQVPADVPTTGPNLRHKGEHPPVMPLLATKHTPAGAVAFAKFFIQTIDWAYATTSTTYMRHYYEPTCVTCRSIASAVDKAAAEHHHFVGDRLIFKSTSGPVPDNQHGAELSVVVKYVATAAKVLDRKGRFIDGEGALHLTDRVWLTWRGSQWQVAAVGPIL